MKVRQCSKCTENTEYFCQDCQHDVCRQCKQTHDFDLETKHHDVTIYREKKYLVLKKEMCKLHPNKPYIKYCKLCEFPFCFSCTEHRNHPVMDIRRAYKLQRQQCNEVISKVRTENLFSSMFFLAEVRSKIRQCSSDISSIEANLLKNASDIKYTLDWALRYKTYTLCFLMQCIQLEIKQHDDCIKTPIKFLRFCKDRLNSPKLVNQSNGCMAVMLKMLEWNISYHRPAELKLMELMKEPMIRKSFSVKGVHWTLSEESLLGSRLGLKESVEVPHIGCFNYISCVGPNRAWVSKMNLLILTNTSGEKLYTLEDLQGTHLSCTHTVTCEHDLIYIDATQNIRHLSADLKTRTILIKTKKLKWEPISVYCSPHSGDILVGMIKTDKIIDKDSFTIKGMVTRYNRNGKKPIIIAKESSHIPYYLAENTNGDVVISGYIAVVVTDSCGNHRFSFWGHLSDELDLTFRIYAVCTDTLSNILLCNWSYDAVQIIDKNGKFLRNILTKEHGIFRPVSMSYDVTTHRVWINSGWDKTIHVYKLIERNLESID